MNHNKFPTKQLRISDLKSATSKDLPKDQRLQSANNSMTMRNLAAVVHQNSIDTSFNSADVMSPSLFPNDNKLTRKKSFGLFSDQSDNTKDVNTKSRIPDILMINKYYGLIPQKFTIASRGSSCSKPSSARRTMKSSSAKPRASSGLSQDMRSSAGTKGCRSENDSPDPIKMVVIAPKGVNELKHEVEDKPIDPLIGPVTKKMSVEKYKKWKHGGGGKGRNLSIRTCGNIGNTMSLTNKRLSDGIGSHAIGASGECIANRRVIKIDLNNASWDEENYQITPYSQRTTRQEKVEESRNANVAGESEVLLLLDNSRSAQPLNGNIETSSTRFVSHCKKESGGTHLNANHEDSPPRLVSHGESLHMNERTEGNTKNNRIHNECPSTSPDSETTSIKSCTIQEPCHEGEVIPNKDIPVVGEINGNSSNMNGVNDRKLALFQRGGRLSNRTISFDGVVSEGVDKDGFSKGGTGTDNLKKRPATATARSTSNKTVTTPNNFNPPSKVIPWTQQKADGGKPLTLAERRAKFQRTSSIHSSSSQSLEVGEDDVAEVDNHNAISQISLSSPVYREPRKPLYVMQPPEVPTMISQINPNADEDIQIEIEKVAIMLKKMQTFNHFSMSLDSGIEAEMRRKSSDQNVLKSAQSSSTLKSTESLLQSQSLNSTESESSISSVESNSSEEQSLLIGGKTSSTSTTASRMSSKVTPNEKFSSKSQTEGMTAKQTISKNSSKQPCNPLPKKVSPANSVSSSTNATVRRPPLRKAVSISCEQELLKAGGGHSQQNQNEVNSSAVEKGRSSRPKTAAGLQHQRVNAAGTRPSHNYSQQRVSNNISSSESHNQSAAGNSCTSTSQGSRNRKILIKKALMEINQSSVNLRRKWGTLGRPRTAPTLNKANGAGTMSQQLPTNSQFQERRKPLKASPLPISGNGKAALTSSGKSLSTGGKSFGKPGEDGNMEQSGPTAAGLTRASSEVPDENHQQPNEDGDEDRKGKSKFRQCFSLDESALLGFSIRSVNDGKIPLFEKWVEMESAEGCSVSTTIMDDEISFLSSKKREQCLKVYEKLLKTGCTVKLDTIFRGMLTPSEYRAFMKAAEKAAQEAEDAAETAKLQDEQFNSVSS